jgi:SAM-dependent methyltransferase
MLTSMFAEAPVIEPLQPAQSYPDMTLDMSAFTSGAAFRMGPARDLYIAKYGYVLLTAECAEALGAILRGKRVLDAGCGVGFVAKNLSDRGIDVTAVDLHYPGIYPMPGQDGPWKVDQIGPAEDQLPGEYDAVLLCWPPHKNRFAKDVAERMRPGQLLIYCGEGSGGCCANRGFFRLIEGEAWEFLWDETDQLNEFHLSFLGIRDHWRVMRRR